MAQQEAALKIISDERSSRMKLFAGGTLVGAATGAVIAFFRGALEYSEDLRQYLEEFLHDYGAFGYGAWFAALVLAALILSRIVAYEPMSTGSGIPQVKGILLGEMRMRWLSVLLAKVFGGILAIGAGMSLGREGPSVQIGACVGQGISELRDKPRTAMRLYLTAGAGAGLAAAFNAPLAGVIFCLEELTKSFSPLVLMATIAATVTATVVTQFVFGGGPVFHFPELLMLPLGSIWLMIPLGIAVGLLGVGFNKGLFFSLDAYGRVPKGIVRPLIPLFAGAGLFLVLPQVLGGGNRLVDSLVAHPEPLSFLIILLVVKYAYTMLCFGSGVPGGIFLPMLVLGAVGGSLCAVFAETVGLLTSEYAANFIVFGMAAYFASVVKSPVTGSILVMEMTGSFEHLLALILVSVSAYLTADALHSQPVYDALLLRSLKKNKQISEKLTKHRSVVEFSIAEASRMDGMYVKDFPWPVDSLLVSIQRGETEITPHGVVKLQAGDLIYVLVEDREIDTIRKAVE
ncbi:ClC family H(+)/Cl(-) exchange transporter [Schwartzia sp. (in: firmicutes)]